jgi:hypothetical protein
MRSTDKRIGSNPDTKRSASAAANIFARQRTVMISVRWREYAPSHRATCLDADIKSKAINVAHIILRRPAIVWLKAAFEFLMRAN